MLEVKHLTVRSKEGRPLVQDVSFTLTPGEPLGLTGASGSGKQCFEYPEFVRRSIEGCTEGPESAFLWRSDTVSFGKTKEMGSGKTIPKGVAFGLCLLFARAKRKSPQGETLPRKAGDGFLYRFFWQDKRNGVGKIASQRRQPLDTSSRTQSLKRPRVKSLAIAFHTNAA